MEKKDETIPGQMSILDLIEEEPQSFEDYIGKCRFCMWNGYLRGSHPRASGHASGIGSMNGIAAKRGNRTKAY